MNLAIETIIEATKGMTPKQFEAYAESNDILYIVGDDEWDEVCITDFNSGVYSVALPDYDVIVYSLDGGPINFTSL
jgi:hypothetical protein